MEKEMTYWKEMLQQDLDMKTCESFWDDRAEEFSQRSEKRQEKANELAEDMVSRGYLSKNSRILDIGCGPGTYSLAFAKQCQEVVAMDISSKMLEHLKEKATQENLETITPIKGNWDEINLQQYGWHQQFDLVIASMSPAIHDGNTFDKMMEASRGYCYVSAFIERKDLVGDEIHKRMGKEKAHQTDKIQCIKNILRLKGIHPEIHINQRKWEMRMPVEEAFRHYTQKIRIKQALSEKETEQIQSFLDSHQEAGEILEKTEATVGELLWCVL